MKNNGETVSIHPFNKYLLCSFEVAGTIQDIGNIEWNGNSPWSQEPRVWCTDRYCTSRSFTTQCNKYSDGKKLQHTVGVYAA